MVLILSMVTSGLVSADEQVEVDSHEVMEGFNQQAIDDSDGEKISEEKRHIILFSMGLALIIMILLTASFGLKMGLYGKPVFIQHMVCAGITVTLALAHAVAAMIWFFPF